VIFPFSGEPYLRDSSPAYRIFASFDCPYLRHGPVPRRNMSWLDFKESNKMPPLGWPEKASEETKTIRTSDAGEYIAHVSVFCISLPLARSVFHWPDV
jgi:hypothetical protein